MVQSAVKAWALVNGRDHATEDDLRYVTPYVLLHRLRFHAGAGDARKALETLMQPAMEKLVRQALTGNMR
jgi:MoxR-like ATPase